MLQKKLSALSEINTENNGCASDILKVIEQYNLYLIRNTTRQIIKSAKNCLISTDYKIIT